MKRRYFLTALAGMGCASLFADLKITRQSEEIPEAGRVPRYVISSSAGSFGVNPPHGWVMSRSDSDETISFRSEQMNASLSIRFLTKDTPRTAREAARAAHEQFPDGKLADESVCYTRDKQGVAVESLYRSAGESIYRTRLGFVNYPPGGVEFKLTAPDATFSQVHFVWVAVLNSFQREAAPAGKGSVH